MSTTFLAHPDRSLIEVEQIDDIMRNIVGSTEQDINLRGHRLSSLVRKWLTEMPGTTGSVSHHLDHRKKFP